MGFPFDPKQGLALPLDTLAAFELDIGGVTTGAPMQLAIPLQRLLRFLGQGEKTGQNNGEGPAISAAASA